MLLKAEGRFPGGKRGGGVAGPAGEFAGGEAGHRLVGTLVWIQGPGFEP